MIYISNLPQYNKIQYKKLNLFNTKTFRLTAIINTKLPAGSFPNLF